MRGPIQLLRESRFHAFLFALFFLGLVWPILAIPSNQGATSLFRYLILAWGLMILSLCALACGLRGETTDENVDGRGDDFHV
jgi:hypothetical protein